MSSEFFDVYPSGIVEIGLPGTAGFSIRFSAPSFIISYLPTSGSPAALETDYADPGTTSSAIFGGEVLALRLNIDFSDAGLMGGTFGAAFGDLTLCNSTLSTLNGLAGRDSPVWRTRSPAGEQMVTRSATSTRLRNRSTGRSRPAPPASTRRITSCTARARRCRGPRKAGDVSVS